MSVTVKELYSYLNGEIPSALSCEWDNDGLMVCRDENRDVKKILLTLDVTDGAIEYAVDGGFDVIISHHPLIFRPIKSLSPSDLTARRAIKSLVGGVSVMSFHTRLDAVDGGVNDVLCELIGVTDAEPFGPTGEEIARVGTVPPVSIYDFAKTVQTKLGADTVIVTSAGKDVNRVAILGGDGKDYVTSAVKCGVDTFVTGRCGYNVDVDARDLGINIIEAGHYYTEAPVLCRLAEMIESRFAGILIEYYDSNPTKAL